MGWKGIERRLEAVSFSGLERRAEARASLLASVTRLPVEQVRELVHQRHREELQNWEAAEYQE